MVGAVGVVAWGRRTDGDAGHDRVRLQDGADAHVELGPALGAYGGEVDQIGGEVREAKQVHAAGALAPDRQVAVGVQARAQGLIAKAVDATVEQHEAVRPGREAHGDGRTDADAAAAGLDDADAPAFEDVHHGGRPDVAHRRCEDAHAELQKVVGAKRRRDLQLPAITHQQAGGRTRVVAHDHVRIGRHTRRKLGAVDDQVGTAIDQQAANTAAADAHLGIVAHHVAHLRRRFHEAQAGQAEDVGRAIG